MMSGSGGSKPASGRGSSGRSGGRGRGSRGGRGRGRGRGRGGRSNSSNNNFSLNEAGRGQQQRPGGGGRGRGSSAPPPKKPAPPTLQNGAKGAESHTVSEADRIRLTKILMEFRENDDTERLDFPSTLTNTERKFVHEICAQLGLKSKSTGKGENRSATVTKINPAVKKQATDDEEEDLPVLKVGKQGMDALKRHVQKFPPTHAEDLEAHETGASIMEALAAGKEGDNDNDTEVAKRLQQLGLLLGDTSHKEAARTERPERHVNLQRRQELHAAAQRQKRSHPGYSRMLQTRAQLPAYSHQEEIVQTVAANPVTIISGDTGCGKSTQVPQFILDANPTANIVVTQPRRISAVSIAERVAQEQCQEAVGRLVGYQVRLDSAKSPDTQLLFLTPGVLLRQMQSSPLLQQYTTIIIDEIHERDKYQEFLLIVLRDLIPLRPDLRVILMSATLQTVTLGDYFTSPAIVEMQGRMFPVQEFFLEHVLELTKYVDDGDGGGGGGGSGDGARSAQLEAELAKLLMEQTRQREEEHNLPTLQCMVCGKTGFLDGVELGAHVGLCAVGGAAVDNDGSEGDDDDGNIDADVEFEEYDVEENIVLEDFDDGFGVLDPNKAGRKTRALSLDSDDAGDVVIGDAPVEEEEGEKWDGKEPFNAEVEMEVELTTRQEYLLDQYQGMHDDEQIDNFLLLEVVRYIVKSSHGDGAILVFLPGWQEISEFTLLLESTSPFRDRSRYLILPLHSGIPSKDQRRVLRRPPDGTRKIVLSTNIAETSLTIDDIAFVVDSGRAKEKNYDPHLKTSTLQSTWISQASAKQRKGRAGRTKAGVCFHLFSSRRHSSLRPFTESELLRTPLEELCLMCKQLDLAPGGPEDDDGIPAFLAKAMSPPHSKAVSNALDLLVELGAMLPETNDLTTLGECLATISLHPRVGKMVIWSYILGCARPTCNFAVAMSYKSPFTLPPTSMRNAADAAKLRLSQNSESDQVTVHYALEKKEQFKDQGSFSEFCRRNFLGVSTMQMISDVRKNLTRELSALGFVNPSTKQGYQNRHHSDHSLWQASMAAGLYPNMALRRRGDVNFSTMTNRKVKVHVSSVNAVRGQPLGTKCQVAKGELEFMCFGEIVKGARMFTANQTMHLASPLPLLLLCGTSLSVRPDAQDKKTAILNMDDWIVFKTNADTAAHIVVLRKRLEGAFWNVVSKPSAGLSNLTDTERDAVEILGTVVRSAHKSAPSR